jgi:hypothetical protein
MSWRPIPESDLLDLINRACDRMSWKQLRLWDAIQIPATKWALHPWGDFGGGFWAVGLIGNIVVWYNDIEEGFNRSLYSQYGVIDQYWCNQDNLEHQLSSILIDVAEGGRNGGFSGPPLPGPYTPQV